jgi:hypothetical protein
MHSGCNCHTSDGSGTVPAVKMSVLERPRYSPGLILEDSDLTAAVDYTRELNRLMFRSLFGCGVICGLDVSVKVDCDLVVTVSPGLALDGCGDPLQLTGRAAINLGKRAGVLVDCGSQDPPKHTDFWVIACSKEKACAPRSLVCDCDDLDCGTQTTRIRSGVEISVVFEPPGCACGCGLFVRSTDAGELDRIADALLNPAKAYLEAGDGGYGQPGCEECHDAHNNDPACAADCGCGTACSCGCCVLLAWVHRFPNEPEPRWVPLHAGVRRFVRPALICDPLGNVSKSAFRSRPMNAEEVRPIQQVVSGLVRSELEIARKGSKDAEKIDVNEVRQMVVRMVTTEAKKAAVKYDPGNAAEAASDGDVAPPSGVAAPHARGAPGNKGRKPS